MMTDKISIVMPCYKGERYVADIVGDVMKQTYTNWELICVSNGAGQKPQLEILRRLAAADKEGRIRVLSEEIGNVSRARNIGIDVATGKWITFVDADDRITTNHLQRYIEAIGDRTDGVEPDIVCGGMIQRYVKEGRDEVTRIEQMYGSGAKKLVAEAGDPVVNDVWNKLFRKEFITLSGVRFDENLTKMEDGVFCCNALLHTENVLTLPQTGYIYIRWGVTTNAIARYHACHEQASEKFIELRVALLNQVGSTKVATYRRKAFLAMGYDCVRNLFLNGCTLSFSEKKRAIQRLVFDNSDIRDAIKEIGGAVLAYFSCFKSFVRHGGLPFSSQYALGCSRL